jgi:hypothetical protein
LPGFRIHALSPIEKELDMRTPRTQAVTLALLLVLALGAFAPCGSEEESKFQMQRDTTVKRALETFSGKAVTLRLDSGDELSGKVAQVGDFAVHLSALTEREFYDAVISLDRIEAVIFRTRNR